jgi:hypothetical protein
VTYPFSDFGTRRYKTGTIGSGELENRQRSTGISASLLLSGPIRMRIQDLLVLNIRIGRTNRAPRISLLRNKTICIRLGQLECVLSIWEIFQSRRSIDLRRRERANFLYLFYSVKSRIRYGSRQQQPFHHTCVFLIFRWIYTVSLMQIV